MTIAEMLSLHPSRTNAEIARELGVSEHSVGVARSYHSVSLPRFTCARCGGEFVVGEADGNPTAIRYRWSLRNRVGGETLCDGCAARRYRRLTRSPLRGGSPCFIEDHERPSMVRAILPAVLLLLVSLAAPMPTRAELADDAIRAVAVLAFAREAGVVNPADAHAATAWLTYPGRLPDDDAVARYLDPTAPMPEGGELPPRLRLLGDDLRLTAFVRAITGRADVTVRTDPRGPTRFDQPSRVIHLAETADLPALLHEAGHAATGTDEAAIYERTFRDFGSATRPEDTALFQCEREADAAFSADLLSAARATRSYWRGISECIRGK